MDRHLSAFTRAELALKLEPLIAAKAKENQVRKPKTLPPTLAEVKPIETRKETARAANVSHDTIHKAKVIAAKAPEAVKAKLRTGEDDPPVIAYLAYTR